jgi:hypothetical protein
MIKSNGVSEDGFHIYYGQKVPPIIDKLDRNEFEWKYENERNQYSNVRLIFAKRIL